jgi:Rod binding domain-containing protein
MNVSPLNRAISAKLLPPEQLAGNTHVSEKDKLAAACQQFEAVLLRQVLEQSMKPTFSSSLVHDSATSGIYRDWMTGSLAEQISRSGTLGLGTMFENQLRRPEAVPPSEATETK